MTLTRRWDLVLFAFENGQAVISSSKAPARTIGVLAQAVRSCFILKTIYV